MAIQDHLPVRRHALLPLHAGQLHRPTAQLGAVPGRFRILRSPLRQHLPKGTIQCFTTEVGLDSRHTRTGIQNKHEQERMYGHILVLSKTLAHSPYFTPLPPFPPSFSELSAARALLVHLLHLSHGNSRHLVHQDGLQNQANFRNPAQPAEATIGAQRANHAADGTAAAASTGLSGNSMEKKSFRKTY